VPPLVWTLWKSLCPCHSSRLLVAYPEPHRIAQPDLRPLLLGHLLAHLHQPLDKRQHEALDIGPRYILQVASRPNTRLERRIDDLAVALHALLPAAELELVEDMIIGAARQHPALFEPGLLDQSKITLDRPYPPRALRILVPQRPASVEGLAVVLGIEEELGLPYHAFGAAQPAQKVCTICSIV